MNYEPDYWVIVEIRGPETPASHRILAGWHGGYVTGDSWRISSGIVKITDCDTHYEVINHSGSVYTCHKNCEGFNYYMQSVYQQQKKQCATLELEYYRLLVSDVLHLYENKHD
jgi:hypothetical protein